MAELKRCRSYTELCSRLQNHLNSSPTAPFVGKMAADLKNSKIRIFKIGDRYWKKLSFLSFNYEKIREPIITHIINNCPFCGGYLHGEDVTDWYLEELEKKTE